MRFLLLPLTAILMTHVTASASAAAAGATATAEIGGVPPSPPGLTLNSMSQNGVPPVASAYRILPGGFAQTTAVTTGPGTQATSSVSVFATPAGNGVSVSASSSASSSASASFVVP